MTHSAISYQRGITIVEVMVAVSLSLIILAGVMHIFINNKQTYRVQEAFARLQESGRFAMNTITKDLRMAGYMGCASSIASPANIVDLDGIAGADNVSVFNGNGLEGFEYSNLPITLNSVLQLTTSTVVPGTDIIRIKRGSSTGIHPVGPMTSLSAQIKLPPALAAGVFSRDDILMVTDCEHADTFAASNVTSGSTPGQPFVEITHDATNNIVTPMLSTIYKEDAEVMKMINHTYYISNNSAGVPSLFRMTMGNAGSMTPEELVDGIEDMQLLYGEDSDDDGTPNRYVNSTLVTDWNNVISIRVELQIRSIEDNVAAELTAYGDHRLRRTFTTSIAIRNRVT
ncbi:PilW family protein [Kaarinaea lacus]